MNTNPGGQSQTEQRREVAPRAKEEHKHEPQREVERDDNSYENLPFTD
jgi:hypothetical protein